MKPRTQFARLKLGINERGFDHAGSITDHVDRAARRVGGRPVPELNIGPGCEASVAAAVTPGRDAGACKRDEFTARDKLKQEWPVFLGRGKVELRGADQSRRHAELCRTPHLPGNGHRRPKAPSGRRREKNGK